MKARCLALVALALMLTAPCWGEAVTCSCNAGKGTTPTAQIITNASKVGSTVSGSLHVQTADGIVDSFVMECDVWGNGTIGLVKGAGYWQPTKGPLVATYVYLLVQKVTKTVLGVSMQNVKTGAFFQSISPLTVLAGTVTLTPRLLP